jgi:DNA-binding MarR family transcriptional regulator
MLRMYELISFVSRGKIRKQVLSRLIKPNTPTKLSLEIKTHRSTTSRTILALEKKGLVKCITPNETMGRYYETTPLGKRILEKLRE